MEQPGLHHEHLDAFAGHYSKFFLELFGENWLIRLKREWRALLLYVRDLPWKSGTYAEIWQRILLASDSSVGAAAKFLVEIERSIAMDTSCAERWFSLMKRLKSRLRNRMNTELLNNLMMVCLHAPKDLKSLKSMLPAILDIWEASSKRGRYTSKWVSSGWPDVLNEMENIEQEFIDNMANRVTYSELDVREQCKMYESVNME